MTDGIEYYDSEQLIVEVEKRPTLYDKNVKDYNDKIVREKLWKEVCEAIIPNWAELSNNVKDLTGRDVQRKWKNIRDCFRKELNHQKRCKTGHGKRKRRKYIFYDQLLFLLPSIQERERKYESAQSSGDEAEEEASAGVEQPETTITYKQPVWTQKGRKHPVYPYEEPYISVLPEGDFEEIDEDKYFLLSLLPSFRNLPPDQKFNVKIEILQTLRNSMYPSPSGVISSVLEQPHASYEAHKPEDEGGIQNSTKQESEDF